MGAPIKQVDFEQLKSLCEMQCTKEECASFFKMDADTLNARIKENYDETFSAFYKRHAERGKVSLRRFQWKSAQNGSVPMQIWLGKQMLNQRDRTAITGDDGGALKVQSLDVSEMSTSALEEILAAKDSKDES